jgi:hypothetical protein
MSAPPCPTLNYSAPPTSEWAGVIIDSFAAADYRALRNEKRIQAVLLGVKGVGGDRWLGRWDVAYTTTQRPASGVFAGHLEMTSIRSSNAFRL